MTSNPCERYLKNPTPKELRNCYSSHAQVNVTYNDPTCGSASENKAGSTRICLAAENGIPREKVLISAVIGIFGKLLGEISCGFPSCLPPWQTHFCGDNYFLNTTSDDPWAWGCQACPDGAACSGNRIWSEVNAKFGYFRLHKNDSCRQDPELTKQQDTIFSYCMAEPDEFYPCAYPPACLGDKNPEFYRQFKDPVTGEDLANRSVTESCNLDLGFNQTCYDRLGRRDSCRLCRACKPAHWAQGSEKCVQCGDPAEIILLSLACVAMVVIMLTLFLHTALAETEELSKQAESSHGHLAQSLQKIILNHLQLLALAGNFPLRWPFEVQKMFEIAAYVGSSGEFMFNPQCVFKAESSDGAAMPDFFAKQLFIVILPIICLGCCTFFWTIAFLVSTCKKSKQNRRKRRKARKKEKAETKKEKARAIVAKKEKDRESESSSSDESEDEEDQSPAALHRRKKRRKKKRKKLKLKEKALKEQEKANSTTVGASIKEKQPLVTWKHHEDDDTNDDKNGSKTADDDIIVKLSRSKLRVIFDKADKKRRGLLDRKQFTRILARHGLELGKLWKAQDIKTIFSEMSDPTSKLMSFDAFVGAFVRHSHHEKMHAERVLATRNKTLVSDLEADFVRRSNMKNQVTGLVVNQALNKKMSNAGDDISHTDKWVATMIALAYLLYPTLCNATFALVGCRYIGRYYAYIQMDMQIKCFDDEHWSIIMAIFFPALLAYVIGIPMFFFALLKKNRTKLSLDKHVKFRYSTLIIGYRPERYYWEVVISLRKAAIVAISVFLLQFGPRVQTLVAQAMTAMLLILHTHFEPFVPVTKNRNPLHQGDFFALVTAFLTLTAGIYLFQNVGESKGFQTFLVIIVITSNFMYISVTGYWYVNFFLIFSSFLYQFR